MVLGDVDYFLVDKETGTVITTVSKQELTSFALYIAKKYKIVPPDTGSFKEACEYCSNSKIGTMAASDGIGVLLEKISEIEEYQVFEQKHRDLYKLQYKID